MGKSMSSNLFPIAMKMSAKTIGLDLVEVKPMSAPKMNILYTDYIYNSKNITRKNKINNIFGNKESEIIL